MDFIRKFRTCKDYQYLLTALVVGFVFGTLFVFLMPPWQHYDEPNHFEYAWLIAKQGKLPTPDDYDLSMRKAVAISMINHGFFKGMTPPDLNPSAGPIWIGTYSQLTNLPLYYIVAAIPLRLLPIHNVTYQLYLIRLFSLSLYLACIVAAWGVACELTPPGHLLRLFAPLTLALLPGFTDLMTSANNDVGAIALVSLAIWGSSRLIHRKFDLLTALLTGAAAVLGLWVKETAFIALPIFLIGLLFSLFHNSRRRIGWIIFFIGIAALLLSVLSFGDAAYWYRGSSQTMPTRTTDPKAIVGTSVIGLDAGAATTPNWITPLFQPIPEASGYNLQGKTYTLCGWMWASKPVQARTPILSDNKQQFFAPVDLGTEPKYFAISLKLSKEAYNRLWISLAPAASDPSATIYYDGLTLAEGERPLDSPPSFSSPDGQQGVWGGQPFYNLIRNGSAEQAGLRFLPWADRLGAKILPDQTRPSLILTYLTDWSGASLFYRGTLDRLFRTFWGLFGWAHVPLVGYRPYLILLFVSAAGIAGAAAVLWRCRFKIPWDIVFLLALVFFLVWGMTFARSAIYIDLATPYFPVARYAYTAIIPTILLLTTGWLETVNFTGRFLHLRNWGKSALFAILLFGLELLAVISIYHYYYQAR